MSGLLGRKLEGFDSISEVKSESSSQSISLYGFVASLDIRLHQSGQL